MVGRVAVLTLFVPFALGFPDTHPIIAWSSHKSNALDLLSSNSSYAAPLLESLLSNDDLCEHDAVVLVDHPGLHASDLRTLSPSSGLVKTLSSAPSSCQFPYARRRSMTDSGDIATSIARRCGSQGVKFGESSMDQGSKSVILVSMPLLEGNYEIRRSAMAEYEQGLTITLERALARFPKHLVILSGIPSPMQRRQSPAPNFDSSSDMFGSALAPNASDPAFAKAGILKRYQLLTPALIITLVVAFFVIVPIVLLGVSALASIQSPMRVEGPKGYNAQERKTQ